MNEKPKIHSRFTMLIPTEDLDFLQDLDAEDGTSVVYHKPCLYDNENFTVVLIEVVSDNVYDGDLEVLLNTYNGIVIHEEWSNCFCMLEDDIDKIKDTFGWNGGAECLMGDMLTPEEKLSILERAQKKLNTPGLIYGKESGSKSSWENLQLKKEELFNDAYQKIRYGNMGEGEIVWWPNLIREYMNFSFLIQSDDLDDEDEDEDDTPSRKPVYPNIPTPWEDEDNYYYHDYEWGDF